MSDITKKRYTEEYKKYRREYMKAYRKRNKSLNENPHNPLWKKKGERIFSDNTKKQYISREIASLLNLFSIDSLMKWLN